MMSRFLLAAVFIFFCINIVLVGFLLYGSDTTKKVNFFFDKQAFPEVEYLQSSAFQSFKDFSKYFSGLAKEKGGAYAFEVLKTAPVPPGIDMHLLAHVVGDILYTQEGLEGIKVCTEDFRNACSHAIVVGLFFEEGEGALSKIAKACYQAPGGSGAYTMCFHGLGHGILAYSGYDLERAVELCKKTGTTEYEYEESSQCVSGAIMETISGVHDPELWARQRPKYFRQDDPLYPCSADFIPKEARYLCYLYLTPHLFEAAGTNTWTPTAKAFSFCDKIPMRDAALRDACYGGFGKEFVGFVGGRDIRASSMERIGENQLKEVYEFCLLADNKEGASSCVRGATNSLYWGGENDRSVALKFCTLMQDSWYQQGCFANLMGAVNYYIKDPLYKMEFCEEIPKDYRQECQEKLL